MAQSISKGPFAATRGWWSSNDASGLSSGAVSRWPRCFTGCPGGLRPTWKSACSRFSLRGWPRSVPAVTRHGSSRGLRHCKFRIFYGWTCLLSHQRTHAWSKKDPEITQDILAKTRSRHPKTQQKSVDTRRFFQMLYNLTIRLLYHFPNSSIYESETGVWTDVGNGAECEIWTRIQYLTIW